MSLTAEISLDFSQDPEWESALAETRLLRLEQASWKLRARTALVLLQAADSRSRGTTAAWLGPSPQAAVAAAPSDRAKSGSRGSVATKKDRARAPQEKSAERVKGACSRVVEMLKKAAASGTLTQSLSKTRDSFHAELSAIRADPAQVADSVSSTRASSAASSDLCASHPDRFVRQEVSKNSSRAGQVLMQASLDGRLRGFLREIRTTKTAEAPLEDQICQQTATAHTSISEGRSRAGQVLKQASTDGRLRLMLREIRAANSTQTSTEPEGLRAASDLMTRAGQVLTHASTNGRMLALLKDIRSANAAPVPEIKNPVVSAGSEGHRAPIQESGSKGVARPSSSSKHRTKLAKAKPTLQLDDVWGIGSAAPAANRSALTVAFKDGVSSFRLDAGDIPAKSKRDSSITKGYDTLGAQFFNISPKGIAPTGLSAMEMDLAGPVGSGSGSAPSSALFAPQVPSGRPSRAFSLGASTKVSKVSKARPAGATVRGLSVGGRVNDASSWTVGGLAARPGLVC